MGYDMHHTSPAQVMEEINGLVSLYMGITYDRLTGKGLQWPCTSVQDAGSGFLYHDGFPSDTITLQPVKTSLSEDEMSTEYPYVLVTVQSLCHSGSFTLWSQGLCELDQKASAEINVKDAEQLRITSGDMIRLTSSKGAITVPSRITERTPPGRILAPYHYSELMVNTLTDGDSPLTRVSIKKV